MKSKLLPVVLALTFGLTNLVAGDGMYQVEELYAKNTKLNGKVVIVKGKVVKISSGIMGKDWIHVQDNSKSEKNKVIFTVKTGSTNVTPGDMVIAKGKLKANVDLGAGYFYAVLVEDSSFDK